MDTMCAYCGSNPATTDDHVFPRSIFHPKEPPKNLITVRACLACNQCYGASEEAFRNLIISGSAYDHPDGRRVWEKVHKSVRRNRKYFQDILEKATPASLKLRSGEIVQTISSPVDPKPIYRVIEKIVRGIYFKKFGVPLPPDSIQVWHEPLVPEDAPLPDEVVKFARAVLEQGPTYVIGDRVVLLDFGCDGYPPTYTGWCIRFYEEHFFIAATYAVPLLN